MSKSVSDIITDKVTKAILDSADMDSILAKKAGDINTFCIDLVDSGLKILKEQYLNRLEEYYYDNTKVMDMFDKVVEQALAERFGIEQKPVKKSKKGKKARK